MYIFRAIYDYTYKDDKNESHSVSIENGSVATCEVFGDGEVAVTGTIEGNQHVEASFTLSGIYVIGVTVKAVKSATDDTEVTTNVIKAGGSQVYKAIPTTGQSSGQSWITYVQPDTYQWYVNGVAVAGATGTTYTFTSNTPSTNYIACLVSKKNSNNIVEYAVSAGKELLVEE